MSAAAERDFEIRAELRPGTADELAAVLADASAGGRAVRLCGTGSRLGQLPAPDRPCLLVSTAALRQVTRLEPDDLTCSVGPGLPRDELDALLAEHRLELPCDERGGTVGGLFATGSALPEAPGAPSPRTLLLGVAGVLAEGRRFKSGARVVKSVAGFDLQKAFVGSRGLLFAATELHLKLRRRPRHVAWFRRADLAVDELRHRLIALLADPFPPAAVRAERRQHDDGWALVGRFEGARAACEERLARHGLPASEPSPAPPMPALAADRETLRGVIRPSRVDELDRLAPGSAADLVIGGGGGFRLTLPRAETDAFLDAAPSLGAAVWIERGAPERRGRGTPRDAGAERVERALRRELDPREVLA
ncbi:MAG: FAD-binding oxidoreductase [Planctomycetes bacterium]|nr:FAD-binding oxidoreductase [Planctomycetota bacterium]